MPRRKRKLLIIGTIVLALVAALGLGIYDSRELEVEQITVQSPQLPPELEGFRIVQLSDWHTPRNLISADDLAVAVAAQHPDLIVMTGDMLDTSATDLTDLQRLGAMLLDIAPVYAVSGNHEFTQARRHGGDWQAGYGDVPILDGDYIDFGSWVLAGARDNRPMPATPPGKFTILLAHRPAVQAADLTFSGHNHGGEWRIPGIGGLVGPQPSLFPAFTSGLYRHDDGTQLVVSRGLGDSIIAIRLNNRPHLVVVTLEAG